MNEEIIIRQRAVEPNDMPQHGKRDDATDWGTGAEDTRPAFNRYIYENLVSNVECQIEYWNRKAESQSNSQAAQVLRLKAEGLGYALRLLYAFEPEFRELVDCASHAAKHAMVQQ